MGGNLAMSCIKNIIFIYTLEMPSLLPIIITCDRSYKTQCPGCHPNYIILSGVEFRYWQFLKFSRWFQRIAQFRKETEKKSLSYVGELWILLHGSQTKNKTKTTKKTKTNFSVFFKFGCCHIKQHNYSLEPDYTVKWLMCQFN